MEREAILVRDGVVAWWGLIQIVGQKRTGAAREYLEQGWRRALDEGAVSSEDAGPGAVSHIGA